jgi:hypothetical protein
MGFDRGSLTGGMGGDYTSWGRAIKTNSANPTTPQPEV